MAYPTSIATDSDLYLTKNQLSGVLNGSLDASQTTVTLASTTGFPAVGVVTVDSEVIKYTSTNATQLLSCTRGFDGTPATTHSSGATVKHAVTAIHHNALKDELIAVETALGPNFAQKYFQTVQGTTTTPTSTTSSTYQSTALTASITPTSSSHRIKITVTGSMQIAGTADTQIAVSVFRGSTDVDASGFGYAMFRNVTSVVVRAGCSFSVIDSPATTSATTYTVKIKSPDNTTSVSFPNTGSPNGVIILEEIL